jgi:Uma2 family endonuclease
VKNKEQKRMLDEPHRTEMTLATTMIVEEYLALDRASPNVRYEYIDGVITMLAGGTINHSRISVNIAGELRTALQDKSCEVFNSDLKVSVSKTRYCLSWCFSKL